MSIRTKYDERVKSPGKFEGEPAFVPYFYDIVLNGCDTLPFYDGDILISEVFVVEEEDRVVFPELTEEYVVLNYHDTGFVTGDQYKESDIDFDMVNG